MDERHYVRAATIAGGGRLRRRLFDLQAGLPSAGGVLRRVGFDRLAERGGVKRALSNTKYDASGLLARLVFYGLMLLVLQFAFGAFGTNPISNLLTAAVAFLPNVLVAVVIVVVTAAIAAAARDILPVYSLAGVSYGRVLANVAAGRLRHRYFCRA